MALKNVVKPIRHTGRVIAIEKNRNVIRVSFSELWDINKTLYSIKSANDSFNSLMERIENDSITIQRDLLNIKAGKELLKVDDATIEPVLKHIAGTIASSYISLSSKAEEKIGELVDAFNLEQEAANEESKNKVRDEVHKSIVRFSSIEGKDAEFIPQYLVDEISIPPIDFYTADTSGKRMSYGGSLGEWLSGFEKFTNIGSGAWTGRTNLYLDEERVNSLNSELQRLKENIKHAEEDVINRLNDYENHYLKPLTIKKVSSLSPEISTAYENSEKNIDDLMKHIESIKQEALNYSKKTEGLGGFIKGTAATTGMLATKFGEGFLGVGENIIDGAATIITWITPWDSDDRWAEYLEKNQMVKGSFDSLRNISGINEYSWVTDTSLVSSLSGAAGTTAGYLTIGGFVAGKGAAIASKNGALSGLGNFLSSTTNANTIVAALGGQGAGTERALVAGETFENARVAGLKQGVVQGTLAYAAGKWGEHRDKARQLKEAQENAEKAKQAFVDKEDDLLDDIIEKEKDVKIKAGDKDLSETTVKNIEGDVAQKQIDVDNAQSAVDNAKTRIGKQIAQKKLTNAEKELGTAQKNLLDAQNKLNTAKTNLATAESARDSVLKELTSLSDNYTAANDVVKGIESSNISLNPFKVNPQFQGYTDAITNFGRNIGQQGIKQTASGAVQAVANSIKNDGVVKATIHGVGNVLKTPATVGKAVVSTIPSASIGIGQGIYEGFIESPVNSAAKAIEQFNNNTNSSVNEETTTDETTTTPPDETTTTTTDETTTTTTETTQGYIYQNGNDSVQPRIDTNEPVQEPSTDSSTTPAKEPSNPSTDSTTKPSTPVDPDPIPSNKPTPEPTPSPKPEPTPEVTPTPTPEPTPTPSPSYEPQPTNTPTPTGHSGGSYSGGGGYNYYPSGGKDTVTTETLKDTTGKTKTAIDDIIKGNKYSKIPTVTTPITSKTTSGSASVIPIAAGLSAAAAAGIGAKAYMDHKKNNNNEDDVYDEEEYKDDFSAEEWKNDNNNLEIEEAEEPKEEYLDEDDEFGYEAPSEEYNARTTESLAEFE